MGCSPFKYWLRSGCGDPLNRTSLCDSNSTDAVRRTESDLVVFETSVLGHLHRDLVTNAHKMRDASASTTVRGGRLPLGRIGRPSAALAGPFVTNP